MRESCLFRLNIRFNPRGEFEAFFNHVLVDQFYSKLVMGLKPVLGIKLLTLFPQSKWIPLKIRYRV